MQYSCRSWLLTIAWQTRKIDCHQADHQNDSTDSDGKGSRERKRGRENMREARDTECQPEKNKQAKWERQKTD